MILFNPGWPYLKIITYSMKRTNNSVITFRCLQSSVINLRVNCWLNCGVGIASVASVRERITNIIDSCFGIHHHVMHMELVWRAQNKCTSCSRHSTTSQEHHYLMIHD